MVECLASEAQRENPENPAVQCLACCAKCLVKCVEDIVEYLGRTAYAYQAVSGESFCTSAWHGFLLQLKHCSKVYFANSLASLFILKGKIVITLLNCLSLFLVMKYVTGDSKEVSSYFGPMFVVAFFSFLCTTIFLGLFDEAVLSTITCMAIDMDLNNGSPAYGPPTFHEKMSIIYG